MTWLSGREKRRERGSEIREKIFMKDFSTKNDFNGNVCLCIRHFCAYRVLV